MLQVMFARPVFLRLSSLNFAWLANANASSTLQMTDYVLSEGGFWSDAILTFGVEVCLHRRHPQWRLPLVAAPLRKE